MPDLRSLTILVTGATGFVGAELVRGLLAAGVLPARLRCLVRDPARATQLGLPAASLRIGDLTRPDSLAAALAGAQLIFHAAGTVKASRAARFLAANAEGTRRLVAAASAAGDRCRFVLVSSLAAAGPSTDGSGSERPAPECRPVSAYGESKRQAELAVAGSGLPHTIVRPPFVYGPGDPGTRLMFRQASALVCAVPIRPRPLSVIHVQDVVTALLAVAAKAPGGAVLPLDGPERTDTHTLVRAFATAIGRRARLVPVPLGVAAVAAGICDLWACCSGREGFFNRDKIRELRAVGWVADGGPARRLLGFEPQVRLQPGLAATARAEGHRARG